MRFNLPDPREEAVADIQAALEMPGTMTILNRMIDGVVVSDTQNRVLALNSAAEQINAVRADHVLGSDLQRLMDDSSLHWTIRAEDLRTQRRKEFIVRSVDGRAILTSIRFVRGDNEKSHTLLFQRDLQVLDHLRRTASATQRSAVFKFYSDAEAVPDLDLQRHRFEHVGVAVDNCIRALNHGARLLLAGESGSGKTELAKYLHRSVGSPEEPFVHVNCAAIPESLFEGEMFGHEKGTLPGDRDDKRGLIESAEGGTLFLDEISEIPLVSQARLLRFLEDGTVQRIGARVGKRVKTRVISATNQDLWQLVTVKRFRQDLYFRLAVITEAVMPLREQPELLNYLVDRFVSMANRMRTPPLSVSDECREALKLYAYPGNIRELHNLVQQLSVVAGEVALRADLPGHVTEGRPVAHAETRPDAAAFENGAAEDTRRLKERVRLFERQIIDEAIDRLGSKRKAARALGVDIGTIVRKTQKGR